MDDQIKTKEQLIEELQELRRKVAELQELGQPRQTEETLQAQALRRAWFDNVADPIFIFDQKTKRFLDCNQATIDRYGYTLEELRTMTPHQLHPPEELEIVERNIDDRDDFSPHHYTHITKDGTRLQVEILTNEIEYDGRDAWLSITRDITERKRVESEIIKLNRELAALNDIDQALISTLDLQETLTIITDHVTRLMGVEAASVTLHDKVQDDLWFAAASGTGASFIRGTRMAMGRGIVGWVVQHGEPLMVPDVSQDTRWFADFDEKSGLVTRSILCVPLQAQGQTIGAVEVMNKESGTFDQEDVRLLTSLAAPAATAIATARLYDQAQKEIVEHKRAEQARRESEEKYRTILENIEEGYFEVDLVGNFTFFNDTLSNFLGYPPDELMGLNYRRYVGKENVKKVFQTFSTVYQTGEPAQAFDWEVIRKDGERRLVESSVSLIRDYTGAPIGFRGIVRDVTGHRQAEIERERLLTVLERRGTQLQTAAEVSRAVGSILDPEALAPQVVDLVRERFGLYYAGLFLVDQTGEWTGEPNKWAVLRAGTGEAGRQMLRQGHKLEIGGTSMIGWCIANKQARITLDVGEDAVRFDNPHLPNTRSELALPLISRGRPIGALTIQSDQEAAFTKEDIAALQTMGDQMANAIANARLYDQAHREINERKRAEELTRRRAAQTTLVYEVGKRLSGELELEPLLSEIVTAVYEAFDYYNVMLLLFDEETLRLSLQSIAGGYADVFPADLSFAIGESIIGRVAATGKPQISGDVDQNSHYRPIAGVVTKSELSVPIKSGQKTIGVLDLQSNRFNAFDETDVMIMETMADQITIAIKNARLFEALQKALKELEEYTYNLEHQTAQLQVGAEVAREAAAIRDVQQLLNTAVRLISDRFGFYHAGAFLIDEMRQYAVMRAASSEGGQRMLARGHKLPVGKVGIVGHVAGTGEARVALDVDQDDVHFAHGDLPDTRSEMGLPLNVRDRTIGVLDVQSREPDAFSDNDVAALQTLADQLAVAIDNARLTERTEAQLRELSLFYGQYSTFLGAELASPERSIGYVYDGIGVVSSETLSVPALDVALTRGETVALAERASRGLAKRETTPGTEGEKTLATPLKLHDQIIGGLGIQESDRSREWSPNEITLIEAVSDQVALALENAQHFAETQRSAQQLQILNDLARSLAARLTVQEVLEETYQGASRLLDTANFYIAFHDSETNTISFPLAVENEQRVQWSSRQAGNGLTEYVIRNREPVLIPENVSGWLEEKGIEVIGAVALSWLGAPLILGDQVLGAIAVQGATTPQTYDQRDRDLLTAIASQTAIALENARLFEETQRRVQELSTLFDASQALTSTLLRPEEIVESVARRLIESGNMECSFSLLDADGETLRVLVDLYVEEDGTVRQEDEFEEFVRLSDYPATARVIETLQPLVVQASDPDADPAELAYMRKYGVKTLVIIPWTVKGRAIGVMELEAWEERHYTPEQLNLAVTLVNQAAVAMENARLFEEAQRRAAQLTASAEVARDATSILEDIDQLLDETVHLISEQFGFYHAGLFLLDEKNEYAVLRAASSEGGKRMLARRHKLPVGKVGIVGHVAATGEPRVALDVGQDNVHFAHGDLPDTRSEMGLPLKVRGQVIGVLDVQSTEEAAFSDEDVRVLQTLADQLASAIANARLFQEVRTDAMQRALINEVQQAATASLDPNELLHRAGEVISRRLERSSAVFIWDFGKGHLRSVAIHDERGHDVPLADDLRVTRKMHPLLFSEVVDRRATTVLDARTQRLDQPTAALAEQMGIQAGIYVPLVVRGQVLGVLTIAQPEGDPLEGRDFIEIVGTNLSVALESARLYQEAIETAEQLQEMDRLKNQFLANMSHELRTPLNSIIGFSRVILKGIDGPLTDMQRIDLEAVYNSGQQLLELINGILDIAKIQAGKMELTLEDTNLNEVIKVVMATAVVLVKDKPVELQQFIAPDLPIIRADPRRVRQILINLVGNASKFTEEGFIRVEVKANSTEVIIAVTDSGIGIPEDEVGTVFEEFMQVDGSSTRAIGGTGLGLPITRHFVEMHGGRIWVESTVNVGSTFYVALPIAGPPEKEEKKAAVGVEGAEARSAEKKSEPGRKTVLCVDDDEGVITLFRRYLGKQGYRVIGLTESTTVMEIAQRIQPFAITLDVMMPKKDGWQVIQELKSNPKTQDIPVIMCSIVAEKDQGISLGASGYLVKPIMEKELLAALERLDRSKDHHRVLVVDDHAEDRNLLRRMIESQEGYEVTEAVGGQEAIVLVQQVRPDVIILDLMMPDVDGFAVLESVKADEATRSIPVIVVTAKTLTREERDILNRGVESLLQKAILEPEALLADIATALGRITATGDE